MTRSTMPSPPGWSRRPARCGSGRGATSRSWSRGRGAAGPVRRDEGLLVALARAGARGDGVLHQRQDHLPRPGGFLMTLLCRYWRPALGPTLGAIVENRVYDLAAADPGLFGSFTDVISSADPDQLLGAALARLGSLAGIPYAALDVAPDRSVPHLLAPVTKQEVWAAGVTYLRSRDARMSESETGGSFYDRVYAAERPEL